MPILKQMQLFLIFTLLSMLNQLIRNNCPDSFQIFNVFFDKVIFLEREKKDFFFKTFFHFISKQLLSRHILHVILVNCRDVPYDKFPFTNISTIYFINKATFFKKTRSHFLSHFNKFPMLK